MSENMIFIWVWLNSSNIIIFHSIHFSDKITVSFFPMMEKHTVCICSTFFIHSSIAKHLGWFCNCEQCCSKHRCAKFFFCHIWLGIFWGKYKRVLYTTESSEISMASFCCIGLFFLKPSRLASMLSRLVFIPTSSIQGLMRQTGTHLPNNSCWCSATYSFGVVGQAVCPFSDR